MPENMTPAFEDELEVEVSGAVGTITLNRPEAGNALTRAMMIRLAEIIRNLGIRPDTKVIVLAARGDVFCSGRDGRGEIREAMSAYEIQAHLWGGLLSVLNAIAQAPIPIVACVQGPTNNFEVYPGRGL